MDSWQFSSLLWNLRQIVSSVPPDACYASQLERCFNASLHELILSCSIFEKIDPSRVFPFLLLSCRLEFSEQDIETKMVIESTFLWNAPCIVKIVLVCVPSSSYLTSWISGRDSCLVGVSCHSPRSALAWFFLHPCIMSKFLSNLNWGIGEPQKSFLKMINIKNCFKCFQGNVPFQLWKILARIKFKPIFLEVQKYLSWAFELNPIVFELDYIHNN